MDKIERYLNKLIDSSTPTSLVWNVESKVSPQKPSWNYIDGCMMNSILEYYRITKKKKYFDFVKRYLDYFIHQNGDIEGYNPEKLALDDICSSRILFQMADLTQEERFNKAIDKTYQQIKNQPRTHEGNFWHKNIYPNQVWLDGFYMVMPFYVQYSNRYLNHDYQDIISMYEVAFQKMFDKSTGLYHHGYDASKQIFWADKETGLSKSFWLRAIGWFLCSIVDVYEYLQDEASQIYFRKLFQVSINGILQYRDKKSSMFYQVVNQCKETGNYLETSGSAMVSYSILKAVRLGIVESEYRVLGEKIFKGISRRYLECHDDTCVLGGICLVAGLGPANNLRRDGTYQYYISEPIVENESKGIAPFMMAYVELKKGKMNDETRN